MAKTKDLYQRRVAKPRKGENPFIRRLGETVRTLREKAELSQLQVAERCGRAQGWISRVENGQMDLPVSMLVVLAKALRTTVVTLVSG